VDVEAEEDPSDPIISLRVADHQQGDLSAHPLAVHMLASFTLVGKTRAGRTQTLRPQGAEIAQGDAVVIERRPDFYLHAVAPGSAAIRVRWSGVLGELVGVATLQVLGADVRPSFRLSTYRDDECTEKAGLYSLDFTRVEDVVGDEATVPVGHGARVQAWLSADEGFWFRAPPDSLTLTIDAGSGVLRGDTVSGTGVGDISVRADYIFGELSAVGKVHVVPTAPTVGIGAESIPEGPRVLPERFAQGATNAQRFFDKSWRPLGSAVLFARHSGPGGDYSTCISQAERQLALDPTRSTFELDGQSRLRAVATGTSILWISARGFQTPVYLLAHPLEPTDPAIALPEIRTLRIMPATVSVKKDSCQALTIEAEIGTQVYPLDTIDLIAARWSELDSGSGISLMNCAVVAGSPTQICPLSECQTASGTQSGVGMFWWLGQTVSVPMTFLGH